jgi:hypothetical protein
MDKIAPSLIDSLARSPSNIVPILKGLVDDADARQATRPENVPLPIHRVTVEPVSSVEDKGWKFF